MAYAKYVTKRNKEGIPVSYGPYYYKSVRTSEGKVRNVYLGSKPESQEDGRLALYSRRLLAQTNSLMPSIQAGSRTAAQRFKKALVRLMAS